ncbi:hypothetical protein NQ176_g10332 [Zarea fungicola]|uniref:Uncharacterized protein n=1 Tax=Zarea fungicola TaxID=93591 RepID=A0ACC1MHB8_9HYPO|nr:hypothetical protein NQ176_g10332 [Lecanicillium fungicola]
MSLAIWPPISPEELKLKEAETLRNELEWITAESLQVCRDIKHGLEDCYALLAPIDPGSTLVMSTPRNEKVKGTITRVGTRIVKGLRTTSTTSLTIDSNQPIYIPALETLYTHLTEAVSLLDLTIHSRPQQPPDAATLASTLTILAESLDQATTLLKGRPLAESDPTWQTSSCPAQHFTIAGSSTQGAQSSSGVGAFAASFAASTAGELRCAMAARARAANAPVNFGVKLGLAIGTMRRLEHDEMDTVFRYTAAGDGSTLGHKKGGSRQPVPPVGGPALSGTRSRNGLATATTEQVHVREKVRVVSADPSLISLYSKLGYLSHVLGQTRRNLAAVIDSFPQD